MFFRPLCKDRPMRALLKTICYIYCMNITIPKQLQKRILHRARQHGITERKYVQEALRYIVAREEGLEKELRNWRSKARSASLSFWQKHDL